jgi:hypothetical protein
MTTTQQPIAMAGSDSRPVNARGLEPSGDSPPNAAGQADQLDRIVPLVSRWTGGMATLWTYTVSNGKLVLRLTRPNVRGNLHLTCYDCRRICAPTFWGNTALQVTEDPTAEGRRYVIRDEAGKVEVRCGYIVAAENVEPIY